jgi:GH25 family lysozyme M1 (1,4-beta-N-acetylmuramidase)
MSILQYIKTLLAPPLVMPDMTRVWGVDVSHWNPAPVDFQRMKDMYHLDFAIIKGADGTITSRYFYNNVLSAKAAGIIFGLYVWLYPNNKVSIDAQVKAWRALEVEIVPPLGLFIDCEWTTYNGVAANPVTADLRMAHDNYFALSGSHATTYTAPGYANSYLKGFDWSHEPLWIAHYGVASPALPIGATTYQFWQFASTLDGWKLDPSGNQKLDGNYFNGTHEQFTEKYGAIIPPTGEPMTKYTATATANDTRLRPDHNVNLTYIDTYPAGTKFNGDVLFTAAPPLVVNQLAGDQWLQCSVVRAGVTKSGWVAITHMGKPICSLVENVIVPPPVTFAHALDVTLDGVVVYHKDFN